MLQISRLAALFGEEPLFEDLHFTMGAGQKVGLVGPNGSGKTTLLRLLAGELPPHAGSVSLAGTALYLGSHARTVGGLLAPDLVAALQREDWEAFEDAGGWARYQSLPEDLDRDLRTLSGGEVSRLALQRLQQASEDLLLLDEPSASLDGEGIERLETFLRETEKAVLLVSHDRRLLDRVTTRTLAMARHPREYGGNYSFYRQRRAEEEARAWREFEDQQRRVRRLHAAVKGLKDHAHAIESTSQNDFYRGVAKGVAAKAKARQTRLERMLDEENRKEKPRRTERMRLDLPPARLHGQRLLATEGLEIRGGERIALTGPNGSGKTTLLRRLPQAAARPDLRIGTLDQTAARLKSARTALELLWEADARMHEGEARTFLHRFLLTGPQAVRPACTLSDGQRMRLALALVMAAEPDLLLLDEPTSHLDLDTVEALEDALDSYGGAILAVSHDREFLERLGPDRWLHLEFGRLAQRAL